MCVRVCVGKTGVINLLGAFFDQPITDGWRRLVKDPFFFLLSPHVDCEKQRLPLRNKWSSAAEHTTPSLHPPLVSSFLASFYFPSLLFPGAVLPN